MCQDDIPLGLDIVKIQLNVLRVALLSILLTTNHSFSQTAVPLPVCLSIDSDSDNDGYGWENGQSCIVPLATTDALDEACHKMEID